jgi:hypothetical protein
VQHWLDTDYTAKSRAAAFFAGFGLMICQLAINVVDNAFSAGMDLAGLFPAFINIRRGAYVGLILSAAMCPWELLNAASTFISVLSAYSVFLGPMVGIMCCEYWVLRKRRIKLSDLYHPRPDGIYYFWCGINWRSFFSWVVGWSYLLPGFAHAVTPQVKVPEACMFPTTQPPHSSSSANLMLHQAQICTISPSPSASSSASRSTSWSTEFTLLRVSSRLTMWTILALSPRMKLINWA